jgi:16S rRNA processing protein RimM
MAHDRVCVGVIAGAHGVKGAARVKSFTAAPAAIAAYGPVWDESGERRFELEVIGELKGAVLVTIAGVTDREAAEALKGVRLYVDRAVLPEPEADEFYHADLVGLAAELSDGTPLGEVRAVHNFGAGDVIEVGPPDGPSVMVPFTRAAVPVVDTRAGRIVIDAEAGLVEGAPDRGSGARGAGRRSRGR